MSELHDRLTQLSPEQHALLEKRLAARGLDPKNAARDHASDDLAADEAVDPDAWRARSPVRAIDFSLYLFSDDGSKEGPNKYRLALEAARFADANGFVAVWTPERHFQAFGGLYPNPSVLGAALAAITSRVGIRAGSVALPLHHPIRVAEEWSVVDNLSNGRAAISVASGWHPDDFILFPTPYAERKETMFRAVETLRRLWAGEAIEVTAVDGREIEVRSLPRPIQRELPIWVTTAGNAETWERAGAIGANLLGALVGYSAEDLTALIARYRAAREKAGHDPATGKVTLVVHTFVGESDPAVKERVRAPMTSYLKTYLKQFQKHGLDPTVEAERDARDVAGLAFEHYFEESTLLGSRAKCARVTDAIAATGADELACLIDFGLDTDEVLAALPALGELARHYARPEARSRQEERGGPHART